MERTQITRGELSRSPINDVAKPKIRTGITGGFRTTPEVVTREPIERPGLKFPEHETTKNIGTGTAEPDWGDVLKNIEKIYPKGGPGTPGGSPPSYPLESRILDRAVNGGNGGGDGSPLFSEDTPLPGKIPLNQFTEVWTQEQGSEEGVERGYSSGGGGTYSTGGGGGWQPEQAKAQEIPYNLLIYGLIGLGVLYLALKKGKK